MSLQTKPNPEATPWQGQSASVRKSSAAPAFKPEFLRSVRMHPLIAAAVALLVFAAIVGYALQQRPMYEAEALVYVEPAAAKVLDDSSAGLFDSTKYDSFLQQEIQTSQRLDILKAALHSLPVGVWQGRGESDEQAAMRLQAGLKAERVLNSYELSFTLRGPSAQGAATTLNAVIASLLSAGRQNELSLAGDRTQILTEEKNRISAELAVARTEQAKLSASLGMANPGLDTDNPYDAQLTGLRAQLGEAREAHDVAAAQLASVSGPELARTQGLTAAAEDLIASDAGLSSMRATISQRRAVLSGQMAGLTAENPIYKQDQLEIADLDRTLDGMTTQMRDKAERRLQDKLRTDLARTGDVEARLNAQLASQTYAATSAAPKLQRAAELTADVQRLMKRYATVDDALRSVQLETSGPGAAHLAVAATTPVSPVASRRKLMMAAALPIGLLCGAFAAVFFRKRDQHVYTGRDLEELLGFAPIAVLPAPDDVPDGVMQEYVLRLAGGMEHAFRTAGARSFVLTPTGTAIAAQTLTTPLAVKLRQLGLGVATTTARQLMELAGEGDARAGMMRGETHQGSVVEARLEALKQLSDLVFIDSPALLTSAETEYLVRCADATILIASSGVTRRGELLQATLLLERMGVKGVGTVLEGLHLRNADAAYRVAVADLDRRQSFEVRAVRTLEPAGSVEPVIADASALAGAEPAFDTVGRGQEVLVDAPAAEIGEMMNAPAQEPVPAAAPEIETPEASAQATEETLPMAVQFLHLEQPDEPVQTQEAVPQPEVSQAGVVHSTPSTRSGHRRVPVRRVQAEPEAARSWFQRIFQRDAEPVVSILPDDEEEESAEYEPAGAAQSSFEASSFEAGGLDLPVRGETGWTAPVALSTEAQPGAETAGLAAGLPVVEETFVREVHAVTIPAAVEVREPEVLVATETAAGQVDDVWALAADAGKAMATEGEDVAVRPIAGPIAAPVMAMPVADDYLMKPVVLDAAVVPAVQPVRVQMTEAGFAEAAFADPWQAAELEGRAAERGEPEPVAWVPAVVQVAKSAASLPPVAEPVMEPAAPREVISRREAARQVEPDEPFRTGRWEAARQASRAETTPWRDRRVSGPNAIYRAPERRFNWNTEAGKPLALVPNPPAEPARTGRAQDTRAQERPRPIVPERPTPIAPVAPARLTRQWGLLSRFEEPQSGEGGREQERKSDQAGARGYRRG